ncbi:class I SAM-dependent methyltransferase [Sphingomonas sp. 28-62-20]|uniref:class I SAM-dependent methyltransferase n=1 Tax=Sphingomonas sp. 28-62-20 TaxID=1970433 RepID=UPI0026ACE0A8
MSLEQNKQPSLKPPFSLKDKKVERTKSAKVFGEIFRTNYWGSSESVSGEGSTLDNTSAIRAALPPLIEALHIRSILDIPCGDFHWMNAVGLDLDYHGGDIVAELVAQNQQRYGSEKRRFSHLDVRSSFLPKVDLILVRDCLVHMPTSDVRKAISNIRLSGAKWLLATTFTQRSENDRLPDWLWRPLNMELSDFDLGKADRIISEEFLADEGRWSDKSLGLWRIT